MHTASLVAIFVDLENVGGDFIQAVAEFGATQGRVCHLAVYADWRRGYGSAWDTTIDLGGVPKQILRAGGKNSADISIVIDVMEFLTISADLQVYVLATGDSDFVPLAQKLRSRGKLVIGVAPEGSGIADALISACDRFEMLTLRKPEPPAPAQPPPPTEPASLTQVRTVLADLLASRGPMTAGAIGTQLQRVLPGFRYRVLGYRTLSDLLRAQDDLLEVVPSAHDLRVALLPAPAQVPVDPTLAVEPFGAEPPGPEVPAADSRAEPPLGGLPLQALAPPEVQADEYEARAADRKARRSRRRKGGAATADGDASAQPGEPDRGPSATSAAVVFGTDSDLASRPQETGVGGPWTGRAPRATALGGAFQSPGDDALGDDAPGALAMAYAAEWTGPPPAPPVPSAAQGPEDLPGLTLWEALVRVLVDGQVADDRELSIPTLVSLPPDTRYAHLERVLSEAQVSQAARKAKWLAEAWTRLDAQGGAADATRALLGLPDDADRLRALQKLPGIGPRTAGAVLAYLHRPN